MEFESGSPDLSEVLRSRGLRVTPQRLAVLAAVRSSSRHLTVEEVYRRVQRRLPHISLATVYKALGELRELGELKVLPVSGKLQFDGNLQAHHHLVCERCGRAVDIEANGFSPPVLEAGQGQGFEISGVEVTFRGVCPGCREQKVPPQTSGYMDRREKAS